MALSAFKRALNYSSTYIALVKDFVAFIGAKAPFLLASVMAAGLLYPLPFAVMAGAVYAMMGGRDVSSVKIGAWHFQLSVDNAFLLALGLAAVTLTFVYVVSRVTLTVTTSWQTSLLWRGINRLPVMARWDRETIIPLPLKAERIGIFLTSLVRSAFLIGLIVRLGVPSLVMALGALVVLTWLDPVSVMVLIVVALLCLPIYAWALLGMLRVRRHGTREMPQQQALLKEILRGITQKPGGQIDSPQLPPEVARRFASGYGMVNAELQALTLINLIVGLHVFLSIAVIYLINGASLSHFVKDKIFFFVVLLFMMRAMMSLVMLFSRLSRAYSIVAGLRAYLHPKNKRISHDLNAPTDSVFALKDQVSGSHHFLVPGQPAFVVMPDASRAFELLPLSNELKIVRMPPDEVLRHIEFLNLAELRELGASATAMHSTSIEIVDRMKTLRLPVRQEKFGHQELGVVAISRQAWDNLAETQMVAEFCRNRIVFVVVANMDRPTPPASKTLLIVSDGEEVKAVGHFDETWRYVNKVFERSKSVKIEIEDEELV